MVIHLGTYSVIGHQFDIVVFRLFQFLHKLQLLFCFYFCLYKSFLFLFLLVPIISNQILLLKDETVYLESSCVNTSFHFSSAYQRKHKVKLLHPYNHFNPSKEGIDNVNNRRSVSYETQRIKLPFQAMKLQSTDTLQPRISSDSLVYSSSSSSNVYLQPKLPFARSYSSIPEQVHDPGSRQSLKTAIPTLAFLNTMTPSKNF